MVAVIVIFSGGGVGEVCAWQGGGGRAAAAIPLAPAPLHSLAPNQDGEGLPWTNSPFSDPFGPFLKCTFP